MRKLGDHIRKVPVGVCLPALILLSPLCRVSSVAQRLGLSWADADREARVYHDPYLTVWCQHDADVLSFCQVVSLNPYRAIDAV